MKNIIITILYIVLISFNIFAEDISDFEIEGISIGDSLLDYYSETDIKNNSFNYYNDKTFTPVQIKSAFFNTYDEMSFNYKTNDKNFIILGIEGHINMDKNIKECEEKKMNILKDIKKILIDKKFNHWEGKHTADPSGKSTYSMHGTEFDNGDVMNITCYDYSRESGWGDHLNIAFRKKEFNEFLDYAYR